MWRYLLYSPPENRRPLRLQKYGERRKPGEQGGARSTFFPPFDSVTLIVTLRLQGSNKGYDNQFRPIDLIESVLVKPVSVDTHYDKFILNFFLFVTGYT